MATVVCYIFYKNIMMSMTMYWCAAPLLRPPTRPTLRGRGDRWRRFNFFCAWSGQKFNLEVGTQMYNLVWTSIPILCIGILDRDVSNETARKLPQLYHMGIRSFYWNRYVILRWFVEAMYESVLISLLCIFSLNMLGAQGTDPSVYYIGAHTLTNVITVLRVHENAHSHTAP